MTTLIRGVAIFHAWGLATEVNSFHFTVIKSMHASMVHACMHEDLFAITYTMIRGVAILHVLLMHGV